MATLHILSDAYYSKNILFLFFCQYNICQKLNLCVCVCWIRMERLKIGKIAGKAKVVGTLLGIGGALILTFIKGAEIHIWSSHINLLHNDHQRQGGHVAASHHQSTNYVLGFLLALAAAVSASISLIIQVIHHQSLQF